MMRIGRAARALLPCLLALSGPAPARAQELETVWLELPDCATPPYDPSELLRSLELELTPYHLHAQTPAAGKTPRGLSVSVELERCDTSADSLTLRYGDALGHHSRKRTLPLRDVPKAARTRTLALVIAEALRPSRWAADAQPASGQAPSRPEQASSSELPALAPATADPLRMVAGHPIPVRDLPVRKFPIRGFTHAGTPALDGSVHDHGLIETDDPYPRLHRVSVGVEARARLVTSYENSLLLGAELNLRGPLLGRSQWAFEGSYSGGEMWTPEGGDLRLRWWAATVGVDVPLYGLRALRFGPRLSLSRIEGAGGWPAVALVSGGGRFSASAGLVGNTSVSFHVEVERSLQVVALTSGRDQLPWYGWVLMWGAGLSFDI